MPKEDKDSDGESERSSSLPASDKHENKENKVKLQHLAAATVATSASVVSMPVVSAQALAETKEPPPIQTIPEHEKAFVEKGGIILAYKSVSTDEGGRTVAMVVGYDLDSTPGWHRVCELIAMQSKNGQARVTGRTRDAIHCGGLLQNSNAGYRDMDDDLDLSKDEVKVTTYASTSQGGWYSYSFKFSDGKWYLSAGEFLHGYGPLGEDGGIQHTSGKASYPKDFGYITMEAFRPEEVSPAMEKNASLVRY